MFDRLMATVFKAPETSTAASRLAIASKLFEAGREWEAGVVAQLRGHPLRELGVGVDPGPQRRPADGKLGQGVARRGQAADPMLDLRGVAGELLAQADRDGVLQVGPTDLDDRIERLGLRGEQFLEIPQRRDQLLAGPLRGRKRGSPWGSRRWRIAPC